MKGVLVGVATLLLMLLFIIGVLNYTGFCLREGRWLSAQERIDAAVAQVIKRRVLTVTEESTPGVIAYRVLHAIPYKSKEEFYLNNPDCCRLVESAEDGFRPHSIEKVMGAMACMVRVRFKFRYIDAAGRYGEVVKEDFPIVSNCGTAWSGID